MRRWHLGMAVLCLATFIAGCDELADKPNAKAKAPEGTSKSMENMQGAAGLAPPGGLQ